jgi:hypothetical protein
MPDSKRPTPGVIAAAIVAIIGALLILLGCTVAFFGVLLPGSAYSALAPRLSCETSPLA